MNIKNIYKAVADAHSGARNLIYDRLQKRIQDLSEEEQTPQLKKELYDMILPFVRKYQPIYYAQYKGDLRDLASEMYVSFMTRKGRGEKKENLLDKFDPSITVLPYLVKVAVQRKLIDYSRSDKKEVSYDKGWDSEDDAKRLTLNLLSKNLSEEDLEDISQIEFTDEFIGEMKDKFNELSQSEKDYFKKTLKYYRNKVGLHENFDTLFSYLEEDMEEHFDGTVTIKGIQPDFTIVYTNPAGQSTETPARSRNYESALKKAKEQYPGARVTVSDSFDFFKRILLKSLKVSDAYSDELDFDSKLFREEVLLTIIEAQDLDDSPLEFPVITKFYYSEIKGEFTITAVMESFDSMLLVLQGDLGDNEFYFDPNSNLEVDNILKEVELWFDRQQDIAHEYY